MELLATLLEAVKSQGLAVIFVICVGVFCYRKAWPLVVERMRASAAAREASQSAFLAALDKRDQAVDRMSEQHAAAIDRNTNVLRGLTQTVAGFKCNAR